ncbi:J domain-containing protein [Rhodopirellula sp. P2]|uniref:J domain-containing protein n=1 Tax=Rhodopirellula sp. P2 TaxID=2127060 RepID=UPI0023681ACD|nr:J domain-containing protein [Rhodopirellula sp. P2]WDQ15112.1 J domain-containing protein [Rhodopirellula sp. P2]
MSPSNQDPFEVLGLDTKATTAEIRVRYLELVRQHPPEHDPDRFAEIHDAYTAVGDPIRVWSNRLFAPALPHFNDVVEKFQFQPQRLPTEALLRCAQRLHQSNRGPAK